MLTIDECGGDDLAPRNPLNFAKQIRLIDRYGKILLLEDVTEIYDSAEERGACGWKAVREYTLALCTDDTDVIQQWVFWPCDQRFVLTSIFDVALWRRVREAKPEHDAVLERRWAAMSRGRDW